MKRAFHSIIVVGILLATAFFYSGTSNDIDNTGKGIGVSPDTRSGRYPYDYDDIYIRGDDDLIEYVEDNGLRGKWDGRGSLHHKRFEDRYGREHAL